MKLPEHIQIALDRNETSLGDNPAFPPGITGGRFLDFLLSKHFGNLSKKFEGMTVDEVSGMLYQTLNKCKDIERTCKPALEKLCANILDRLFKIPDDTVSIEIELSESSPTHKLRLMPDIMDDFEFDSVDDMGDVSLEIYKRRMTDALVEGASEYYAYNISNYVQDLFTIQPELPSLYSKIIEASQYLTYADDDTTIDSTSNDGGYVIVKIGQKNDMPSIEAHGAIFPILLQQAIKGILEVSVLGGLPKDINKAKYIIGRSDFAMAEKWDSRLGYPLWVQIINAIKKAGYEVDEVGYNFVLMELSNAKTSVFNKTLQEVFAGTGKGCKIMSSMCDYIQEQKEEDEFNNYIEQQNDKYPIEDGYYTAEELIRGLSN